MHAGSFLIADLFGNTSVKYRQEDDTLALAVKTGGGHGGEGGGWHMMGDIVPSPDEALVGQVRGLWQVLDFLKDTKKCSSHPFRGTCSEDAEPQSIMQLTQHHLTIPSKCSQNTSNSGTQSQKHLSTQKHLTLE